MLTVVFFKTTGGNEPVLAWLKNLGVNDRKIIGRDLRTVQFGWPIGMPLCRTLGQGLYEIRSNITDRRIARLLFFQHEQNLVIVEGFIKKTQGTPAEVLKTAKRRRSEYERNADGLEKTGENPSSGRPH